jgi:two-component system nitrate/nitrite response regulator NarL
MTPDAITVAIIDDHPLFRRGLIQLLATIPGFRLAGEASGGKEGITLVQECKPDMLLLDLNMKGLTGLEVLKVVKALDPDTRVIMITVSDQTDDLVACLRLGADGYLLKDMEPERMVEYLQGAAEGRLIISDALTHLLAAAVRDRNPPETAREGDLTDQESRILECIAGGMSNKLIGKQLGIAEGTVKVHVKHILRKLNLRSRVEAAVWTVEHLQKGKHSPVRTITNK